MDIKDIFKTRTFNSVASTYSGGGSSNCSISPPFASTYKNHKYAVYQDDDDYDDRGKGVNYGYSEEDSINDMGLGQQMAMYEDDLDRVFCTYFKGESYEDHLGNEYFIVSKTDKTIKVILNPSLNNVKEDNYSRTQFLSRMKFKEGYHTRMKIFND